jgi:hypothetical protein
VEDEFERSEEEINISQSLGIVRKSRDIVGSSSENRKLINNDLKMLDEHQLDADYTQITPDGMTPLTIANISPFADQPTQTNFDESLNYSQDTMTMGGNSTIGAMSGGRSTFGRF